MVALTSFSLPDCNNFLCDFIPNAVGGRQSVRMSSCGQQRWRMELPQHLCGKMFVPWWLLTLLEEAVIYPWVELVHLHDASGGTWRVHQLCANGWVVILLRKASGIAIILRDREVCLAMYRRLSTKQLRHIPILTHHILINFCPLVWSQV